MRSRPGTLTVTLTACALASLPVFVNAQTTPRPHPRPTTSGHRTTDHNSPPHHLQQAKRALDSLAATTLTGDAGTQVADIRRHFEALESGWRAQQSAHPREASVPPGHATGHVTGTTGTARAAGTGEWMTHYSAIDRILDRILGATASRAGRATAGTSGSAGSGVTASADVKVDAATRSKLTEFRKHLNAFHATAMTGTSPRGAATLTVPDVDGAAATTGDRATPQARGTTGIAPEPAAATKTSAAADSAAIARLSSAIEDMLRAEASPGANTVCVDRAKLEQLGRDLNALGGAR